MESSCSQPIDLLGEQAVQVAGQCIHRQHRKAHARVIRAEITEHHCHKAQDHAVHKMRAGIFRARHRLVHQKHSRKNKRAGEHLVFEREQADVQILPGQLQPQRVYTRVKKRHQRAGEQKTERDAQRDVPAHPQVHGARHEDEHRSGADGPRIIDRPHIRKGGTAGV